MQIVKNKKTLEKKYFFFSSLIFNKFINKGFKHGKKEYFETALLKVLMIISRKVKIPGIFLVFEIFELAKPIIALSPKLKKKKRVLVPFLPSVHRMYSYAFKWVIEMFRAKPALPVTLSYKIENVFLRLLLNFSSTSCYDEKKKLYTVATENRVYRHFR
jgi:ribosomal protein S7